MYIPRKIEKTLQEACRQFPAVLVTGPRQAGKSTLLKHLLPGYRYVSLDDLLVQNLALQDPSLFLNTYEPPVIIDEIQYAPLLLPEMKMRIDANRRAYGQYVLTGSQIFPLMKGVSESLAGRIAVLQLYPFSWEEIPNIDRKNEKEVSHQILKGFYPEFQVQPHLSTELWHSSYLSTYIERDLRALRNIRDLGEFQRYLILLASRAGQLLNLNEIGKECGISQTTAKDWLTLLQATSIIYLLEPFARNLTKRVVKSPKLFFVDTGLLAYLLRIYTLESLVLSPFGGHLFENMVVMEAVKQFAQKGMRPPCYFYRTSRGQEVDLVIDQGEYLNAYEIKFSSNPSQDMTKSLAEFKEEQTVKEAYLLNLRQETLPFSNGISAIHWNTMFC